MLACYIAANHCQQLQVAVMAAGTGVAVLLVVEIADQLTHGSNKGCSHGAGMLGKMSMSSEKPRRPESPQWEYSRTADHLAWDEM